MFCQPYNQGVSFCVELAPPHTSKKVKNVQVVSELDLIHVYRYDTYITIYIIHVYRYVTYNTIFIIHVYRYDTYNTIYIIHVYRYDTYNTIYIISALASAPSRPPNRTLTIQNQAFSKKKRSKVPKTQKNRVCLQ